MQGHISLLSFLNLSGLAELSGFISSPGMAHLGFRVSVFLLLMYTENSFSVMKCLFLRAFAP